MEPSDMDETRCMSQELEWWNLWDKQVNLVTIKTLVEVVQQKDREEEKY